MANLTRICLIGPECTGKSQLSRRLAEELRTICVPEFAREHAIARGGVLGPGDVEIIARGQMANEDSLTPSASRLVVLDTDLISTVVYARHYYGACPAWIEEEALRRRAHRYLLMDTDVAWEVDAVRDRGGDAREDLFDAFRATLDEFETRWTIVSGDWEMRWQRVRAEGRGMRAEG